MIVSISLFPTADCRWPICCYLPTPKNRHLAIGNWQLPYSYLSATNGSTCVALLAGIQHATSATATNAPDTTTNVVTSFGVTPNNNDPSTRENAIDAPTPSNTPT